MLKKENKSLLKSLKVINKETEKIFYLLDQLLSRPDKAHTVTVDDERFELAPTSDHDEAVEMAHKRLRLIEVLLQDCFKSYIKAFPIIDEKELQHIFAPIIAFTLGADPKDFRVKKKYKVNPYKVTAKKSAALNLDSYYVKNDLGLQHVKENEDLPAESETF